MHDHEFFKLLDRFDLCRSGYRKVRRGVKKRIRRHMQDLGCRDIGAYLTILENNAEAQDQCRLLLTVSISRFFRDRQLWQDLERKIFPALVQAENTDVRIWSAGCACGEEVYSIRIIWHRIGGDRILPPLRVTATDVNGLYIEKAQAGLYSASSLKNIPEPLRPIYFTPAKGAGQYRVRSFLKHDIIWRTIDFFSDTPGSGYHVIFLRNNLLTYYREHSQKIVLEKILDSLADNGFLIVGAHESLPMQVPGLAPFGSYSCVLKKERNFRPLTPTGKRKKQ
ncbi:MAG: CheR family methyltransferase [Thermodesulfobacteriota bacterium]